MVRYRPAPDVAPEGGLMLAFRAAAGRAESPFTMQLRARLGRGNTRGALRALVVGALLVLAPADGVRAADPVELAGDALLVVLPATAFGAAAARGDSEGALQYAKAGSLTIGVTFALKYSVDEERPNGGNHSFPSGHTSVSFSAAEFLRKRYGWEYGLPAYAAAAFVGYSRVESQEHFVRDVVAGAVIGIGSSYLFTKPYRSWSLGVAADAGYLGFVVSRSW